MRYQLKWDVFATSKKGGTTELSSFRPYLLRRKGLFILLKRKMSSASNSACTFNNHGGLKNGKKAGSRKNRK